MCFFRPPKAQLDRNSGVKHEQNVRKELFQKLSNNATNDEKVVMFFVFFLLAVFCHKENISHINICAILFLVNYNDLSHPKDM